MFETGQDWKIAALRSSMCVHFFCDYMFHVKRWWCFYMNDEFMRIAYDEAIFAFESDNVPVGAVIVRNGEVIAKAHNLKNSSNIFIFYTLFKKILQIFLYIMRKFFVLLKRVRILILGI